MKTIKIIDLLNKIAKGEEVPKYIRYRDISKHEYNIMMVCKENIIFQMDQCVLGLNDEVEIIEEEKEMEKLDVALLGQCDNWLQHQETKEHSCLELNPYIIDNIRENTLYFQIKINELIDIINELKRGN